jgi:hypothetical protein
MFDAHTKAALILATAPTLLFAANHAAAEPLSLECTITAGSSTMTVGGVTSTTTIPHIADEVDIAADNTAQEYSKASPELAFEYKASFSENSIFLTSIFRSEDAIDGKETIIIDRVTGKFTQINHMNYKNGGVGEYWASGTCKHVAAVRKF